MTFGQLKHLIVESLNSRFKSFRDVRINDRGEDYAGRTGTIIRVSTLKDLIDFMDVDMKDMIDSGFDENYPAVLVKLDEQPTMANDDIMAYVYDEDGESGFLVYSNDKNSKNESTKRDQYDEIVRLMRKVKQEYGERGVAKFLIDAFGYDEVKQVLLGNY